MKRLIIILLVLGCQFLAFGQGWQRISNDSTSIHSACQDYDGGYMVVGTTLKYGTYPYYDLQKIGAKGELKWRKTMPKLKSAYLTDGINSQNGPYSSSYKIIQAPDSSFLFSGFIDSIYEGGFALVRLNKLGDSLWTRVLPLNLPIVKSGKTELVIMGGNKLNNSAVLLRLNLKGDTIFHKILDAGVPFDFEIQSDGYLCLEHTGNDVYKMDFTGKVLWRKSFPLGNFELHTKILKTRDSSYYINPLSGVVIKINTNADLIWRKALIPNYFGSYIVTSDDGVLTFPAERSNTFQLAKFDKNGNKTWEKSYTQYKDVTISTVLNCKDGGYLVLGVFSGVYFKLSLGTMLMKIDENGVVYSNNLEGNIQNDLNKNCQSDAGDKPFKACTIEAKSNDGNIFWGSTDSIGRYAINIDTGSYTFKAYPPNNNKYWQPCTPSVSKIILSTKKTDSLDFLSELSANWNKLNFYYICGFNLIKG
jgi:hypothetical protein